MMKKEELVAMRAIALCHKPYLKPEEAMIYCNLGRTSSPRNVRNSASTRTMAAILKGSNSTSCCRALLQLSIKRRIE
jgi:hypothetical protein